MGVKSRTNELWLHICTAIFGTGSWLTVNSVYVQLPLLVNRVPEGWNLATYMVLIVQIACISPLIYGCLWNRYNAKLGKHNHIRVLLISAMLILSGIGILLVAFLFDIPSTIGKHKHIRVLLISAMLILSGIGILLVAFLYDIPSTIGNSQHSVWLFLAIFIMSIPCTTSDLLNLPYIYKFADSSFVTSYFIGMGLSALIPSGLSLIQGGEQAGNATITDGNNNNSGPLFSTKTFLFIIFVVILFTLLAFWMLVREKDRTMAIDAIRLENFNSERPNEDKILKSPDNCKSPISSRSWYLLLSYTFILAATQNAIIPVILSFATESYGTQVYHTANSLSVLANPLFCFLQFVLVVRDLLLFSLWTVIGLITVVYIIVMASLSSPLAWSGTGASICFCAALGSGLIAWERAAIAHQLSESASERGLFWCGAATQIGSFVGAVMMFLLSNVAHVFRGS